jgi:hypothetical protein
VSRVKVQSFSVRVNLSKTPARVCYDDNADLGVQLYVLKEVRIGLSRSAYARRLTFP